MKIRVIFILTICLLLTLFAACQTGGEQTATGDGTISDTSVLATMPTTSSTPPESTPSETTTETAQTMVLQTTLQTYKIGEPTWTYATKERQPLEPDELAPANSPYFFHSTGGFSIEFPESWNGRYCVAAYRNGAAFYQQAVYMGDSGFPGRIFIIQRIDLKAYPELEDMAVGTCYAPDTAPWEHMLMGRNDKYAIVADFPSDLQIPLEGPYAEAIGKEYAAMVADIHELRFKLRIFDPPREEK